MTDKEDTAIQPESSISGNEFDGESHWDTASILSTAMFRSRVHDGRPYVVLEQEEYGFPMDAAELERIELCHAKYFILLDKKRFLAPITATPHTVLDLGCGTGVWCIDFADAYPSAEVIGIDIAPTQPEWSPPNCRFEIANAEDPWLWQRESIDFIFARDLITAIRDWPKLIDSVYTALKPGGWVEFQSMIVECHCDDGTLPPDGYLAQFSANSRICCDSFGTPVDDPLRWKGWLEERGFVSVTEKPLKLPCSPWPKDPRLKLVGAFEMDHFLSNSTGLSATPFRRILGWSPERITTLIEGAKKEVKNMRHHGYWPFQITYAQKPFG